MKYMGGKSRVAKRVIHGNCIEKMRELPDNSIDAVVTDPPYGLSALKPSQIGDTIVEWVSGSREATPSGRGFMGKDWDSFVPPPAVWDECLRVLKPGGHMVVFAGARTQDLMGLSIRLAGFEVRDTLGWIYGSGFPKSHDIGKAIDKRPGVHHQWDGWGTALKPAIEPIILARKPLDGTVAANVLAHGVGGLNIDASRIETTDDLNGGGYSGGTPKTMFVGLGRKQPEDFVQPSGRFPANVLLDEHAAAEMDEQSGVSTSPPVGSVARTKGGQNIGTFSHKGRPPSPNGHGDSGGASRFFPVFKYQAKAPKKERPVIECDGGTKIQHPTVKPIALMEWLVKLIAPPGGTILDPFAGSGTTLEAATNLGFNSIGIEQSAEYVELIEQRLSRVADAAATG